MENYVIKKCACCGEMGSYLSNDYKTKFFNNFKNFGEPTYEFLKLTEKKLDICPRCHYVADDITKISVDQKDEVKSKLYQSAFNYDAEILLDENELESLYFTSYSYLNDGINSIIGYIGAYKSYIRYAVKKFQQGDHSKIAKDEYDSDIKQAQDYLKIAEKELVSLVKNKKNAVYYVLLSYIYKKLENIEKADANILLAKKYSKSKQDNLLILYIENILK